MNILFISQDLSGGDLCLRFKNEGHSVRLFIDDEDQKHNYEGIVEKTEEWEKDLDWVGKEGLIVFDSCGFGKIQDQLRKKGFLVVGGCELGDKLEHNRQYGQDIFAKCNIPVVESANFNSVTETIEFIKKNEGPWVVKQNGHVDKSFNYVGKLKDGSDVIGLLENYCNYNKKECLNIDIQKKIEGIEIGVARYFNGKDWVGPIEINIEHKDLFVGGLGPKTFEMGTLMWFDENEENKLFQKTLSKLKDYLKEVNFVGDIDINCIVNGDEIYPLEATARFGWPATHLHVELIKSPMGDFLKSVANGKQHELEYSKEYGVAILIVTPPFPYQIDTKKYSPQGERILFLPKITEAEMDHIHLEEVSKDEKGYYVSGSDGFVLHVTHKGKTVEAARENVYALANKVVIPKVFYRNDIGASFMEKDEKLLREWGWI